MSHSGTNLSEIQKEEGTVGSYYVPYCESPAVRHDAFGIWNKQAVNYIYPNPQGKE